MNDSLQKIIDDMKYDSDPGNEVDPFVALKEYIERLEVLQKQPVAWMLNDENIHNHRERIDVELCVETDDMQEYGYTEPLIKAN